MRREPVSPIHGARPGGAADQRPLRDIAEQALAVMRAQGFDAAQVSASRATQDEVNISHNEASLLRSTETCRVGLLGLVDGRKASTELSDFDADAICERIAGLYADAQSAPQDDANAVSSGQHARIVQGPQDSDLVLLADKAAELLAFRSRETPRMMVDEGAALHSRTDSHTLTTGGSDLACSLGWYALQAFGTARDGTQSSFVKGDAVLKLAAPHIDLTRKARQRPAVISDAGAAGFGLEYRQYSIGSRQRALVFDLKDGGDRRATFDHESNIRTLISDRNGVEMRRARGRK